MGDGRKGSSYPLSPIPHPYFATGTCLATAGSIVSSVTLTQPVILRMLVIWYQPPSLVFASNCTLSPALIWSSGLPVTGRSRTLPPLNTVALRPVSGGAEVATCFATAGSIVSSVALTQPSAAGAWTRYQVLSLLRSSSVTT